MSDRHYPRVVILGAGFGGLWAVRALAHSPAETLLLDHNNYHAFLPLLYQVAAAELEPEEIVYPVRSILRKIPNANFCLADVQTIDFRSRVVKTTEREVTYDYLIMGIGSTAHFFGVPGAAEYAFPLKNLDQAITLRNHILRCFEQAAHETDEEQRQRMLTFVVLGGGPTGVEFAGALAELFRSPMEKDYPTLDFSKVRVVLLEATDNLLAALPGQLRAYALARLCKMGVDVRFHTLVTEITSKSAKLKDGTVIPSETVIWTAGVRGASLAGSSGFTTARNGQINVLPTLQVPDHPEVYAIGDLAYVEQDGHPLPMIAPVASQQGAAAARNITRQIDGQLPLPFRYRDRGNMATIGRNAAVAYLWGHAFTGFPAWVLWLGVHIFNLIGFRNRLFVLINWAWDYLFTERAVRVILASGKKR
jgi:NADH:ubiquinone reductase (H+-translocating)